MKKYVLFFFVLIIMGCSTTKEYYSDDVYYSNPKGFIDEYNYWYHNYIERQIFPQFYYGYPYIPFDLLIQQPNIRREPRKIHIPNQPNRPSQSNQKNNNSPIRKFDNKNQ
jgi:hypothetical protein